MTPEQLRIFIQVAEREHLTRAADALHLTPSAVSSAIRNLEDRYGVALFNRIGRRIELTNEGRLFLDEARSTLSRVHNAERMLLELGSGARGTLSIYASQTSASYWLPPYLTRFHAAHPGVEIKLTIGNTEQVANATDKGFADIGFIEGATDLPSLSITQVASDQLIIISGPDHEWTRNGPITWSDLFNADWILREPGSGTRSVFEEAIRGVGYDPEKLKIALELPSNEAICSAVRSGDYVTTISEMVAAPYLAAQSLQQINFQLPTRQFSMITHKERYSSKAIELFKALLVADTY